MTEYAISVSLCRKLGPRGASSGRTTLVARIATDGAYVTLTAALTAGEYHELSLRPV